MGYSNRLEDNKLTIFLLHGVIEKSDYQVRNYLRKHIEKDYFYSILTDLLKEGSPLSMNDVVDHYKNKEKFPPKAFAITFDDGFENNYSVAAPILEDLKVPATIYITTQFVEYNAMSWIDRIEYAFEKTDHGVISVPWNNRLTKFSSPKDKIKLLEDIRYNVKSNALINIDDLINSICIQLGQEPIYESNDPIDLKLSWEQVTELNNNNNFLIGGHTHTHAIMSFLSEQNLDQEINRSMQLLSEKGGILVKHYSYPEGQENCYSESVITALKNKNIICSPTAIDGNNWLEDKGLFHLKRVNVI